MGKLFHSAAHFSSATPAQKNARSRRAIQRGTEVRSLAPETLVPAIGSQRAGNFMAYSLIEHREGGERRIICRDFGCLRQHVFTAKSVFGKFGAGEGI